MEEQMKLNASVTILGGESGVEIKVRDKKSRIIFLTLHMTPENFLSAAMDRLAEVEASGTVLITDNIGKTLKIDKLEFPMPDDVPFDKRDSIARKIADEVCPEGWEPSTYFRSRDSYFYKDETLWARCDIRKWESDGELLTAKS